MLQPSCAGRSSLPGSVREDWEEGQVALHWSQGHMKGAAGVQEPRPLWAGRALCAALCSPRILGIRRP